MRLLELAPNVEGCTWTDDDLCDDPSSICCSWDQNQSIHVQDFIQESLQDDQELLFFCDDPTRIRCWDQNQPIHMQDFIQKGLQDNQASFSATCEATPYSDTFTFATWWRHLRDQQTTSTWHILYNSLIRTFNSIPIHSQAWLPSTTYRRGY